MLGLRGHQAGALALAAVLSAGPVPAFAVTAAPAGTAGTKPTASASEGRADVARALRHLVGAPETATQLAPYVQGADRALAGALAKGAANDSSGAAAGLLSQGKVTVASFRRAGAGVGAFAFGITEAPAGERAYTEHFMGTAVADGSEWEVSWVTACLLVEEEGVVCPNPPNGVSATVPLPYSVSDGEAMAAQAPDLLRPSDLAVETDGDLLIADTARDQIMRLSPHGQLSVFAGTGQKGFSGDGGPAVDARLSQLGGMALAPDGALYFVDGKRARKVSPEGIITTVAGNGKSSPSRYDSGDGGPAVDATLSIPSDVAVSADGSLYIADGNEVREVTTNGKISTFFRGSGPYNQVPAPSGTVAFLPESIAFDGAGNLDVFSFSPKDIFRISPAKKITLMGTAYATQLTPAPDGQVLIASHFGLVQAVTSGSIKTLIDIATPKIAGFGVPGQLAGFQPDGLAVGRSGVIYADTFADNGYSDANAVVAIMPKGSGKYSARVLPIITPLGQTLPPVGAPGFPDATYPSPRRALGTDLGSCPNSAGLRPFNAKARQAAVALAKHFNSYSSGFYADLRSTDRSWWDGLFGTWTGVSYSMGQHHVVAVQPAGKDTFAAAVAYACGASLVTRSLVVDVGPSEWSDQVSHLYLLDRRGHPLVYFQTS